ncbi:sucrase ferredoxin [Actinomadura craniellae]|uniref:Sucrase ferredoxin n=1 Tax=Actinomadura craniellae TaxID=2231787 RepID=A0A365H0G0_9ACTN|nr:sucrase ferredoxin [Actinomadura craniellae]RAY11683.1 sucrase ferredoxin [Actinomadura craniellae]
MSGTRRAARCTHCVGSHTGALPCFASATTKARTWLLIEHPGPWPERIEQLTDPAPLAEAIQAARRRGVRPQLIRRTGRRRAAPPFQVYVGRSLGSDVWLEGRELTDLRELAELDLATVAAGGRAGFGEPVTEPVVLVCTHGRRNVCCARTGAPLARELSARFDSAIWETTHVGGDRYAANLVCLPHGLYYGNLDTAQAVSAVEAYLRGEVSLDRLRGRAGLPEPAQAAEHFIRAHSGLLGVDAVTVESVTGKSAWEVTVTAGQARYRVTVETVDVEDSCDSGCEEGLVSYQTGNLALLNEAALV